MSDTSLESMHYHEMESLSGRICDCSRNIAAQEERISNCIANIEDIKRIKHQLEKLYAAYGGVVLPKS